MTEYEKLSWETTENNFSYIDVNIDGNIHASEWTQKTSRSFTKFYSNNFFHLQANGMFLLISTKENVMISGKPPQYKFTVAVMIK